MPYKNDELGQQEGFSLSTSVFMFQDKADFLYQYNYTLTEAEDIKRWQEYTEELFTKDLHNTDNHNGVITQTHLEPDILECKVKWALGSITMNKACGGDGIPVDLFQILKIVL